VPDARGKIDNPLVYTGLGSFISKARTEPRGATVCTPVDRLVRIQNIYVSASEKLNRSKRTIDAACDVLGLGRHVRNEGVIACKRMLRLQTAADIMLADLAGVSLFLACRSEYGARPITLRQIATAMKKLGHKSSYRSMSRAFRMLQKGLRFRLEARRSEDYVPFVVEKVLQGGKIRRRNLAGIDPAEYRLLLLRCAFSVLKGMDRFVRGGRSPYALAASSVYVASKIIQSEHGLKLVFTQTSISQATGVDEFTIREQVGYIRKSCCVVGKDRSIFPRNASRSEFSPELTSPMGERQSQETRNYDGVPDERPSLTDLDPILTIRRHSA